MSDWDFENPYDTSGGVKPVGYSQSEIIIEQSGHPAVSIATPSPLTLSTQTLSLKNDAAAAITEVDTGTLDNSTTKIPVNKTVYDQMLLQMLKNGSNLAIGSDADGDMYYRASSALARLAKGTANHKLFMNAAATAPEWASGYKVKVETRVGTADSGDVAYTGYGFKPSLLICVAYIYGTFEWCVGMDDGSTHYCLEAVVIAAAPVLSGAAKLVAIWQDGTHVQDAYVKSFDADGFTLTWAKTGDGVTGTIQIYIAAFR